MNKFTSKRSLNSGFFFFSFLLFSCLFVSENVFARRFWNKEFMSPVYDAKENSITMTFRVYDYGVGAAPEDSYLNRCDFSYATDSVNFKHLMTASVLRQKTKGWTKFEMKEKKEGIKLMFKGSNVPESGSMWLDCVDQDIHIKSPGEEDYKDTAVKFTVIWYLGDKYKNVNAIRLNGFWKDNEPYVANNINHTYYLPNAEKSTPTFDEIEEPTTCARQSKVVNDIVIKGASFGQNIKVYTAKGKQLYRIL